MHQAPFELFEWFENHYYKEKKQMFIYKGNDKLKTYKLENNKYKKI
jgi:hypothetical protein